MGRELESLLRDLHNWTRRFPAYGEIITTYYFFFAWDNADPAALFDAALVRPSRNTFDAAVAAFAEVTL